MFLPIRISNEAITFKAVIADLGVEETNSTINIHHAFASMAPTDELLGLIFTMKAVCILFSSNVRLKDSTLGTLKVASKKHQPPPQQEFGVLLYKLRAYEHVLNRSRRAITQRSRIWMLRP